MTISSSSPIFRAVAAMLSFLVVPLAYFFAFGALMVPVEDPSTPWTKLPLMTGVLVVVIVLTLLALWLLWFSVAPAFEVQERDERSGDPRNFYKALLFLQASFFAIPLLILMVGVLAISAQRIRHH
jgi:hypothetical protein